MAGTARPPKRPVAEESLRFGIDIDGTIAEAPHHFQRLIDALLNSGSAVYIITGRLASTRQGTEQLLQSLSIRYSELIMRPDDWRETIAEFKVHVVCDKQIHMMIDNEEEVCWAIEQQTPALAALMLPIPEMPEARAAKIHLRDQV